MSEFSAYPQEGPPAEIDTGNPVKKHKEEEQDSTVGDNATGGEGHPCTHEIKEQPAVGMDEVDFSFWGNQTLLEHCRESSLHEGKLLGVLHQRRALREANLPVDSVDCVDTEGYGAIHYLVTKKHENKPRLLETLVIHEVSDVDLTMTKDGNTALHLAVEHNDLECSLALVSLDADVNKENLQGNTPLDLANFQRNSKHIPSGDIKLFLMKNRISNREEFEESTAVKVELATEESDSTAQKIIEFLQTVGAQTGGKSSRKTTHMIKGRSVPKAAVAAMDENINTTYRNVHDEVWRRVRDISQPVESREAISLINKMIKHEEYRTKYGSRILCLDGGGIRGLIQIAVLREIERRTKRRIVDLFDWIVGTSTGGIIALGLCYGPPEHSRKTVRQLRDMYWSMKDSVFGDVPGGFLGFLAKGNTKTLQEILQTWLGKDTSLSDTTYPKVLIPAVNKKDTNLELHFFNNCFDDAYSKELVWKVARYTSAAPFYFTEFENYIDGGMLANNPSEAALTVIQDFYHNKGEKIPISMVVSVGTGLNPGDPLGEIDIKSNLLKPSVYLDFMQVLGAAVIGKQTDSSCASRCREQGIDYFRFNPELTQKIDLGQHDSNILQKMIVTTREYLNSKKDDLDRLVQRLLESELT